MTWDQSDFVTGCRAPQTGIPRPELLYATIANCFSAIIVVISFLRGLLINHGTPPQRIGNPVESNRPLGRSCDRFLHVRPNARICVNYCRLTGLRQHAQTRVRLVSRWNRASCFLVDKTRSRQVRTFFLKISTNFDKRIDIPRNLA